MKNVNDYLKLAEKHADDSQNRNSSGFLGNMPSTAHALLAQAYATMALAAAQRDAD